MTYLLAIDQGTTSTKALVVDGEGRIVAESAGDFTIAPVHPEPDRVEHDPARILRTVCDAARSAVAEAGIGFGDVTAIGLANQGETVIAFDRTDGRPIHPAISWQDRRGETYTRRWREEGLEALQMEHAGLPLDPYFSASKMAWILDHVAEAKALCNGERLALATSDAWLIHRLTGGRAFVTDAATASRTALLDLGTLRWSEPLSAGTGIPRGALPAIVSNAVAVGVTERTTFGVEVPITGLAVDQQAALFGHRCFTPGQAKATFGTGCFVLANAGGDVHRRARGLATCVAWRIGDRVDYALDGGVYSAGSLVEWLIEIGLAETVDEIGRLAASVADSGGVVLIPAFSGLAAPHWQGRARACFAGMSRSTRREHLVRAALEGIAFRVNDISLAMREAGVAPAELSVDGGLSRSDFLMQCQADLLGVPVRRQETTELTGFGVALMAGLGAGVWRSIEELPEGRGSGRTFLPDLTRTDSCAASYDRWSRFCTEVARWGEMGLTG